MGLLLSGAQDHHGQKVSSINRDRLCPLLSDDQIRRLDAATAIALDYPHNLNRTKRNQKMNGCCRITPEWSASLTSSDYGRVARHPTATWSRTFPTHLWTPIWSCTVQSRLCGGTTESRLQVRAEANRRPSQSRA